MKNYSHLSSYRNCAKFTNFPAFLYALYIKNVRTIARQNIMWKYVLCRHFNIIKICYIILKAYKLIATSILWFTNSFLTWLEAKSKLFRQTFAFVWMLWNRRKINKEIDATDGLIYFCKSAKSIKKFFLFCCVNCSRIPEF